VLSRDWPLCHFVVLGFDLETAKLDQIIGAKAQANGGVYQFGVSRRDPISEGGIPVTPVGLPPRARRGAKALRDPGSGGKAVISSGNTGRWLMDGAQITSSGGLGAVLTSWSIVGQRDFDSSGRRRPKCPDKVADRHD
jgi:hypothetical protein